MLLFLTGYTTFFLLVPVTFSFSLLFLSKNSLFNYFPWKFLLPFAQEGGNLCTCYSHNFVCPLWFKMLILPSFDLNYFDEPNQTFLMHWIYMFLLKFMIARTLKFPRIIANSQWLSNIHIFIFFSNSFFQLIISYHLFSNTIMILIHSLQKSKKMFNNFEPFTRRQ